MYQVALDYVLGDIQHEIGVAIVAGVVNTGGAHDFLTKELYPKISHSIGIVVANFMYTPMNIGLDLLFGDMTFDFCNFYGIDTLLADSKLKMFP